MGQLKALLQQRGRLVAAVGLAAAEVPASLAYPAPRRLVYKLRGLFTMEELLAALEAGAGVGRALLERPGSGDLRVRRAP